MLPRAVKPTQRWRQLARKRKLRPRPSSPSIKNKPERSSPRLKRRLDSNSPKRGPAARPWSKVEALAPRDARTRRRSRSGESMSYETIAQWSEIIGGFAFLIVAIWLFRKFVLPAVRQGEISRNSDLVNTRAAARRATRRSRRGARRGRSGRSRRSSDPRARRKPTPGTSTTRSWRTRAVKGCASCTTRAVNSIAAASPAATSCASSSSSRPLTRGPRARGAATQRCR